jgi:V/A-type H+-transporting ATPase subunit I
VAIEKMSKISILFPSCAGERLEEWLYSRNVIHLTGIEKEFPSFGASGQPVILDEQEAEGKLFRLKDLIAESNALGRAKGSFIDSLLPVKTVVTNKELYESRTSLDLEKLHAEVKETSESLRGYKARLDVLANERERLMHLDFLTVPIAPLRSLTRTFCLVAEGGRARMANVARDADAIKLVSWEVRRPHGDLVTLVFGGMKNDETQCADILRAHGFRILELPDISVDIKERIEEIDKEDAGIRRTIDMLQEKLESLLPPETVRHLEVLNGYWESEKKRAGNARSMCCSQRIGIAHGYIRAKDVSAFTAEMEKQFPGASVVSKDPSPDDSVPVAIRLPRWLRPLDLLINMFGLPDYFSIDPTPYLAVVFLVFFGICFADVVYGLLLMLLSGLMMRRYRLQDNLREFFRLFYYCGISTVVFGVLTGSWAADIYNYLGPNNLLQRLVRKTTVLDMLSKPILALMIALAIGILNQFYGIIMRMIKDVRQSNWKGAVYDGVFWLVYLGGFLVFILASIGGYGGLLRTVSLTAVACGAVGLILTQGREEKSFAGKAIFGLVSLYGIVGGYGTVSFIGDVLSYSRLLALGLTTYIVGMSFNIIANVVPQIVTSLFPFTAKLMSGPVGVLLIVLVMIFGHLFNFFLSILSAFVHSARLILLEWFGRFYQGGGRWFQPHGFASDTVELVGK